MEKCIEDAGNSRSGFLCVRRFSCALEARASPLSSFAVAYCPCVHHWDSRFDLSELASELLAASLLAKLLLQLRSVGLHKTRRLRW